MLSLQQTLFAVVPSDAPGASPFRKRNMESFDDEDRRLAGMEEEGRNEEAKDYRQNNYK